MRFLQACVSLAVAAGRFFCLHQRWPRPALAAWPNDKQITIVTPWPAGAGIDIFCRIVAEELSKKWNAQVMVENRPGASGNIGTAYVSRQPADGYTFIMSTPGPAANNMLTFKNLPYNPLTDFTSITQVTEDLMVVMAGPKMAHIKTLEGIPRLRQGQPQQGAARPFRRRTPTPT